MVDSAWLQTDVLNQSFIVYDIEILLKYIISWHSIMLYD